MTTNNYEIDEYSWTGDTYSLDKSGNKSLTAGNDQDYNYRYDFYYVSDLHLDYKLQKDHPLGYDEKTAIDFLNECVDRILPPPVKTEFGYAGQIQYGSYVILCGDISGNIELNFLFLHQFGKRVKESSGNLMFILGNHELWYTVDGEWNPDRLSIEEIVDKYRQFCQRNDIIFLYNDILLLDHGVHSIIDGKSILNLSTVQLREFCKNYGRIILGGIGFSGKNRKFNADLGIYRNTIDSMKEDIRRTNEFTEIYEKLQSAFSKDERVIVITHNPPRDWINGPPCSDWVYFHGHSHSEEFIFSDERKIFGDNQWGYKNYKKGLKSYTAFFKHDIFEYYDDGIYTITIGDYLKFNHNLGILCEFNKKGKVIMLKRQGFYLFLFDEPGKKLKLMEGGRLHPIDVQSFERIYSGMVYVATEILEKTEGIRDYIKTVSDIVKSFGGNGRIHGTIVDIDFLNHLYINLYDGTVTPYYADDMVYKVVYPDIRSLLVARKPQLLESFEKTVKSNPDQALIKYNATIMPDSEGTVYLDTDIYRISNRMRRLQYTADHNIIRHWIPGEIIYDELLESEMPEIVDCISIAEGCPEPRKPFVLSKESDNCIGKIIQDIERHIVGTVTESDIRELVLGSSKRMLNRYYCDNIDRFVDESVPIITDFLKKHGITIVDGDLKSCNDESVSTGGQYTWKEQIESLILLEIDFASCLLDYLESSDGSILNDILGIDFKGNHKNDLKKLFRKLLVSKRTSKIESDENNVAVVGKIDAAYIDKYIDLYLGGSRSPGPLINEEPEYKTGIISREFLPVANQASYATEGLININLLKKLDWQCKAVKSLLTSVLLSNPDNEKKADAVAAYIYSDDSPFGTSLPERLDWPYFTSDSWLPIVSDDDAKAYLIAHAQVFKY